MKTFAAIILLISFLIAISSCKKDNDTPSDTPISYNPYFQIIDKDGNDVFFEKSIVELEKFEIKFIDFKNDESPWFSLPFIKNDTAVIFHVSGFSDMTLIRLQNTNDVDTVLHEREINENKVVEKSRYYFNGILAYELNFEKDKDLLYNLWKTNQDSLTSETLIFKFQKK